ncbi:MAG: hypothetical protein ACRDXX_18870 [Stackebrandtia sp.]
MSRHPTSTVSLIIGLLFATLAVTGLVHSFVTLSLSTVGLIFAAAFTLAGLIGLTAALLRSGPSGDEPQVEDEDAGA